MQPRVGGTLPTLSLCSRDHSGVTQQLPVGKGQGESSEAHAEWPICEAGLPPSPTATALDKQ